MPRIKRQSIDDLRHRVNIHDVVSPYVTLKKAGAKWKGLSPFSHEKSPSFFVDPGKNLYYCFSSGQGGDIFKFVQTKENLSFIEAVEALAQRFSVPLEYEDDGRPREAMSVRKELFDLHEAATEHYHACLLRNDGGGAFIRKYWTETRRFEGALAREFKIGWAPPDGGGLLEAMLKKNFAIETLLACGLFYYREGERDPARGRPRFRGRLMIPIRDIQGRVIAFTARQTEQTPEDDASREAKYVNSPETPLFRKSDILFNLDRAHAPVKDAGRFILVEGQLDTLRCWSVGIKSAVAPQGTAITENQFILMRRYAGRVDCLLDGDAAGQKAAMRALPLALKAGLEIRYLVLPPESDPDELFLEKGAGALADLDKNAESAMTFAMRTLLPSPNPDKSEIRNAFQTLFEIIALCDKDYVRTDLLREAMFRAGLQHDLLSPIEKEFEKFFSVSRRRAATLNMPENIGEESKLKAKVEASGLSSLRLSPTDQIKPELTTAEYELLLLVLHHEALAPQVAQFLESQWIDNVDWVCLLLDRCLAAHREGVWPGVDQIEELFETDEERHAFANLLARPFHADDPHAAINQCVKAIFENHYRKELNELKTRAANTPLTEQTALAALTNRIREVQKVLRNPPRLEIPPD